MPPDSTGVSERMGSIMSAISDDIEEYEALCKRYGEEVQYKHSGPDCYGKHKDELEWKLQQDKRAEEGLTYNYLELCARFKEEVRWHGWQVMPDIAGYYAKELEDRARREDGKPRRKPKPGAKATSYEPLVSWSDAARSKTRFDRKDPL